MFTERGVMGSVSITLFLFFSGLGPAASDPPPPMGRLVDVGGYRVHLYCTGVGSPTVVVVGGAFSFDWGLVQPEVAKFTQICTYDPSGTAWSDPYPDVKEEKQKPAPRCAERVTEIHRLLRKAGIPGPYVLVGFSIGGLLARLFMQSYPEEIVGMVVVDHAFVDVGSDAPPQLAVSSGPVPSTTRKALTVSGSADNPPVLLSSSPIVLGMEDDQNFERLPQRNRKLHTWAMS